MVAVSTFSPSSPPRSRRRGRPRRRSKRPSKRLNRAPNHILDAKNSSRLFALPSTPRDQKTPSQDRLDQGGNEWDTVKPLASHFRGDASHVVLVDNDAHKAADSEEGNMVVVPTWDGPGTGGGGAGSSSEHDGVLAALVEALLDPEVGLAKEEEEESGDGTLVDVRSKTAAVTARIVSDAPALALKEAEAAAALEAEQRAAAAAAAVAFPQPPQPSASAKRAAKRAAKEAAATAATALGEAVLVLSSDEEESDDEDDDSDKSDGDDDDEHLASDLPPEPVLPETLAAWKTAVLATVVELTAVGAVDLPTVLAYCRHRATSGELKALLNRKALRTALNSAVKQSKKRKSGGGGGKNDKTSPASDASAPPSPPSLVLGTRPDGARGISSKIISKCFAVNPAATITSGGFDEALEALLKACGGKQTSSGNGGGGGGGKSSSGAAVAEAIKRVAIASVADLTVRVWVPVRQSRLSQLSCAQLVRRKGERTSAMRRNARETHS